MSEPYVYVAQHREHREDLMYSLVATRRYELANMIGSREAQYIIYSFSPTGRCKIVELTAADFRQYKGGAPWDTPPKAWTPTIATLKNLLALDEGWEHTEALRALSS